MDKFLNLLLGKRIKLLQNVNSVFRKDMEGTVQEICHENMYIRAYFERADKVRTLRIVDHAEKWAVVEVDESKISSLKQDDYRSLYDVALMTGDEEWFLRIGQQVRGGIACDFEASWE